MIGTTGRGKPKLIFVGAFDEANQKIAGGNLTDCRNLMASSFGTELQIAKVGNVRAADEILH